MKPEPQSKPPGVLRPFLGNPLSRPASLTKVPKNPGSRVARQEDFSSGASSRLAPVRTREFLPLPAGGDRTFGHLPHPSCPCGPSEEAGTAVPITWSPCTSFPSRGSKIFGNKPVDNGDIGSNSRNLVKITGFARLRRIASGTRGCRFVPLPLPPPRARVPCPSARARVPSGPEPPAA